MALLHVEVVIYKTKFINFHVIFPGLLIVLDLVDLRLQGIEHS